MQSRKDLGYSSTRRIAPDHDVSKPQLLRKTLNVFYVVLHQISAFRIPVRIAVTAHIDGHHVIPRGKMWRDVVKRMGDASDAVQHDQRLLIRCTPFEVMNAQPVYGDETIRWLLRLNERWSETAKTQRHKETAEYPELPHIVLHAGRNRPSMIVRLMGRILLHLTLGQLQNLVEID